MAHLSHRNVRCERLLDAMREICWILPAATKLSWSWNPQTSIPWRVERVPSHAPRNYRCGSWGQRVADDFLSPATR